MNVANLRAAFSRGELSRDDFWLQAQHEYRRLRHNASLPEGGAVRGIRDVDGVLQLELRDGLKMVWDPEDLRTAPNMLMNHGEYESRELDVLLEAARRAQIVFDVGANVGWYTLNIARAIARRGGHVYAFEPIPRTFGVLQHNVRLNALQSCTTLSRLGLGERAETVQFYLPRVTGSVAASMQPLFADQENEQVTAQVVRLDDFIAERRIKRLDLLKCDIEGGELFMLRGALESIRRFRPVIFLELLRKWSRIHGYHPNAVISLLATEGYRCSAITPDGLELVTEIDDQRTSTNFLFTHHDSRA